MVFTGKIHQYEVRSWGLPTWITHLQQNNEIKTNPNCYQKTQSIEERERDLNDGSGGERESGMGEGIGENELLFWEIWLDSALQAIQAHFFFHFFFFTFIRNSQGAEPLRSLHDFYFFLTELGENVWELEISGRTSSPTLWSTGGREEAELFSFSCFHHWNAPFRLVLILGSWFWYLDKLKLITRLICYKVLY